MKFLFIFITVLHKYNFRKIYWKNFSIDILRENQIFTFGYLIYKIDKNESFFIHDSNFDDIILNRLCGVMKFDNFQSFSMKSQRDSSVNAFEIFPNKNHLGFYFCISQNVNTQIL